MVADWSNDGFWNVQVIHREFIMDDDLDITWKKAR